jgi:hypothetical protein
MDDGDDDDDDDDARTRKTKEVTRIQGQETAKHRKDEEAETNYGCEGRKERCKERVTKRTHNGYPLGRVRVSMRHDQWPKHEATDSTR